MRDLSTGPLLHPIEKSLTLPSLYLLSSEIEKDAPQENCEASFFINKPQSFVNYFGSWNDKRTVLLIGLNIRGFRHGFHNGSGRIGYINRDLRSVCAVHHISVQVYIYTLGS